MSLPLAGSLPLAVANVSAGGVHSSVSKDDSTPSGLDKNDSDTHASAMSRNFATRHVDPDQIDGFEKQLPLGNMDSQRMAKDATAREERSVTVVEPDCQQSVASADRPKTARHLATLRTISDIQPIKNADNIEVATVDGWKVVVQKNEFSTGQMAIYFEIDSFLPEKPEYEFLRKTSFRKLEDGREGFLLRTVQFRGQVSQGLLLPISILSDKDKFNLGDDVTSKLGITKYERPEVFRGEDISGPFPDFLQKSNEERIQNLSSKFDTFQGENFYLSEKLDGTSSTFYINNNEFGVCSKNYELKRNDSHTFWKIAKENNIESNLGMLKRNLAIQGEVVGEKIHGNKYALKGNRMYVFNIYDIDCKSYIPKREMEQICEKLGLSTCPVVSKNEEVPGSIDKILADADGKSQLNKRKNREGLVWVSDAKQSRERISFKVISNKYLLKEKD